MTTDALRAGLVAIDAERFREPKWPAAPWTLTADGREWAVTTDGHVLVAVHREYVSGDCATIPEAVAKLTLKWLPRISASAVRVQAGRLKAFARVTTPVALCDRCQNARRITCSQCNGTGRSECRCSDCGDEHDAECPRCRNGKLDCPACSGQTDDQPVQFLSGLVNRRKLARVLTAVSPDDDTDLTVSLEALDAPSPYNCYLLRPAEAPTWMALVMPMQHVTPQAVFEDEATWARAGSPP
jgi:hypothetical protein